MLHCLYLDLVLHNAQVLKSLPDSFFAWTMRVSLEFFIWGFSEMLSFSMFFIKWDWGWGLSKNHFVRIILADVNNI